MRISKNLLKFSTISVLMTGLTAGCAEKVASDYTQSGFATVSSSGTSASVANSTLTSRTSGYDMNSDGDGYAYEVGVDGSNGFVARSGMLSTTSVSTLPTSGSATMTGRYETARVTNISVSGSQLTGLARSASGTITLTADFAAGSLTGTSDNSLLTVAGSFASSDLDGIVSYRGIPGVLDGKIGGDQAVGVFHGKTDDAIMAGGFIVDTTP